MLKLASSTSIKRAGSQASLGAKPARFRRPRLLILGCGDVGQRALSLLSQRWPTLAVTRSDTQAAQIRELGARFAPADPCAVAGGHPTVAQLRARRHRQQLVRQAPWTIYLAPPPNHGADDPVIRDWLLATRRPPIRAGMVARPPGRLTPVWSSQGRAFVASNAPSNARATQPRRAWTYRWSYVSTTGVYGSGGDRPFDEAQPVAPSTERAVRRVAAERRLRQTIAATASLQTRIAASASRGRIGLFNAPLLQAHVLRAPGIYAQDRLPTARLQAGHPALLPEHDVWTNHIHADDLARACITGVLRAANARIFNAVDQSDMKMGDYFDAVADALHLPHPPRMTAAEVQAKVSPMMWSFMRESRRLKSERLRQELRVVLRYPTVADTLRALNA